MKICKHPAFKCSSPSLGKASRGFTNSALASAIFPWMVSRAPGFFWTVRSVLVCHHFKTKQKMIENGHNMVPYSSDKNPRNFCSIFSEPDPQLPRLHAIFAPPDPRLGNWELMLFSNLNNRPYPRHYKTLGHTKTSDRVSCLYHLITYYHVRSVWRLLSLSGLVANDTLPFLAWLAKAKGYANFRSSLVSLATH